MPHLLSVLGGFSLILILVSCSRDLPEGVQHGLSSLPEVIDYNFHVKPILSDRCFACHGPDAQKREAELRLDLAESAHGNLASGSGRAIAKGSTRRSQLLRRILSKDLEFQMPPEESNLALTDRERAILFKWVQQGGEYKPHWAFTKPKQVPLPDAGDGWAYNEVDRFIADSWKQHDIEPAPEASREKLIRRLFFDLTGLPPSIADLDRWLSDKRTDSYERLVDSLMTLPTFGERMAVHWLDVARFADSEGYLDDFHHSFWPYRDWVIEAFNKNLPYDQFILWQVGGDQIPDATTEQKLATAFNRNHKQNSEGGVIPEEFRVDYVADRTNTVGAAFMGLTVGCARCHDHKYDPFTQENYYQLFGFFNSTIERGDGIFSLNAIENSGGVPNELAMNAGPVLALPDEETEDIRTYLLTKIGEKQEAINEYTNKNQLQFEQWLLQQKNASSMVREVDNATVSYLTFDDMEDGQASDLTPGSNKATYWGEIRSVPGIRGKAIRSNADGQFVSDGKRAIFERNEPFTVSFWIQSPGEFSEAHVLYNGNDRIQGYRGWDVVMDQGHLHFRLNHAHPYQSLDIRTAEKVPLDTWTHFVWTYDGSGQAEGMHIYRNGEVDKVEIMRNHLYRSTKPYLIPEATVYKPYKGIIIGNRHYDQDFTGGLLDEIRVLNNEADPISARYLYDGSKGTQAFETALEKDPSLIKPFYDRFIDPVLNHQRGELRQLQAEEIRTIDTVQEIMVMGDMDNERPTYILDRGIYDAHGSPVSRNVPESILPWPEELPRNRYGLGQWLIHPDHPLTSRVAVNQFWYLIFGRGLVETVEDFGSQGALPSHPELLDWLAVDFQQNGWDLKRLIKQMVCSATYRQSSVVRPELEDIDPDNILLARGPRYRRSAEMIRDNILAASGLLETKIGGPSAFPYQPPGLWKEVMTHGFFPEYEIDYEDGLYRRSLYTFWKRNMPPPSMLIFDAATRAECQVRRQRSSSPLQALVLLNDPQIIEGCRVLAEKVWHDKQGDRDLALSAAFRVLTSRAPSEKEKTLLLRQYEDELKYFQQHPAGGMAYLDVGHRPADPELPAAELAALARVTNTILNSTESFYKN